jgi:hypothetical protein
MRIGRRPSLLNTQTPEERAFWKTIRAQLSERRGQKRQKYDLRSNREADLYIPAIVRHAAENNSSSSTAAASKIVPFPKA